MKAFAILLLITSWLLVSPSNAEPVHPSVRIADPYIDLRSGPGRGYPVFYSAERGDWVDILKRRTDWFKIRTPRDQQGWVHREQLERTHNSRGEYVIIPDADIASYSQRRWEMGYLAGEFGGGNLLSLYGGWHATENLSVEANLAEVSGSFSDTRYVTLNLVHQPWPTWRFAPFVALGWGRVNIEPQTVLVQADNVKRRESVLNAGLGIRAYLSKRFLLRAEYKHYTILTNRNDNQETEEWKAGFAVFF